MKGEGDTIKTRLRLCRSRKAMGGAGGGGRRSSSRRRGGTAFRSWSERHRWAGRDGTRVTEVGEGKPSLSPPPQPSTAPPHPPPPRRRAALAVPCSGEERLLKPGPGLHVWTQSLALPLQTNGAECKPAVAAAPSSSSLETQRRVNVKSVQRLHSCRLIGLYHFLYSVSTSAGLQHLEAKLYVNLFPFFLAFFF